VGKPPRVEAGHASRTGVGHRRLARRGADPARFTQCARDWRAEALACRRKRRVTSWWVHTMQGCGRMGDAGQVCGPGPLRRKGFLKNN
jgi:hypothetical protein